MPDRAVVDEVPCAWCGGDGYVTGSMPCPECTPIPRALVALSEDRQTLVWLDEYGDWTINRRDGFGFAFERSLDDTGQDADDVLADWLARHDGR